MDGDPLSLLIVILFTLLFSAFFSGMEIAFISANRLKIELDKKQGSIQGRILAYFVKKSPNFIATILLGNNVALVIYGIYMAIALEPVFAFANSQPLSLLLQTILSTLIVLIIAEFLPKAIFRINPNRTLRIGALPLLLIYCLLFVPTIITMLFSKLILKFLKVDISNSDQAFTKIDFDHYVRDINERMDEESEMDNEIQILNNALEFSKLKARDCLIPRTEVIALSIEDEIKKVREKFISTGLSKILIYRDNIDNIIGYVHAHEMFTKPSAIKQILLPISIVPEAMFVQELLGQFTREKRSVAVVVDEFGGTSGIITVEDIVEEIFGEIKDEHDVEDIIEDKIDDFTYMFSGRVEIDYLISEYNLPIEESNEYDTIAGFVLHELEDIPKANTLIETEKLILTVMEVSDSRIELVKLKVKE